MFISLVDGDVALSVGVECSGLSGFVIIAVQLRVSYPFSNAALLLPPDVYVGLNNQRLSPYACPLRMASRGGSTPNDAVQTGYGESCCEAKGMEMDEVDSLLSEEGSCRESAESPPEPCLSALCAEYTRKVGCGNSSIEGSCVLTTFRRRTN